jgi:hypothetical protein
MILQILDILRFRLAGEVGVLGVSDFFWRFVLEICFGDLFWRFVLEIFFGDFFWRYFLEIIFVFENFFF